MKARWLVIGTWFVGVVVAITVALMYKIYNFDWEALCWMYFFPILEFAFIILAFVTYGFIFHR